MAPKRRVLIGGEGVNVKSLIVDFRGGWGLRKKKITSQVTWFVEIDEGQKQKRKEKKYNTDITPCLVFLIFNERLNGDRNKMVTGTIGEQPTYDNQYRDRSYYVPTRTNVPYSLAISMREFRVHLRIHREVLSTKVITLLYLINLICFPVPSAGICR